MEGIASTDIARADRTRTADELLALADEVRRRDAALAVVLPDIRLVPKT